MVDYGKTEFRSQPSEIRKLKIRVIWGNEVPLAASAVNKKLSAISCQQSEKKRW